MQYSTVKDLIEFLKGLDPEMPYGRIGHFGEFMPMWPTDFWVGEAHFNPKEHKWTEGWRKQVKYPKGKVLDIQAPEMGDPPD